MWMGSIWLQLLDEHFSLVRKEELAEYIARTLTIPANDPRAPKFALLNQAIAAAESQMMQHPVGTA